MIFGLLSACAPPPPTAPPPARPLRAPLSSRAAQPVGARLASGIFFLLDTQAGAPDATVAPLRPPDASAGDDDDAGPEAPLPAPFEWVVGEYYA